MNKVADRNFSFYKFEHLASCPEIIHYVSSGTKDIGFSEDKEAQTIQQNRIALAGAVGFDVQSLVTAHQIHSPHVAIVTSADAGKGALDRESRLPDTDAMVTDCEGICLMVLSADCVPVLLYDPVRRVIAAIHAGWRGTAAKIVVEAVRVMKESFACRPENILAGIGPSIGPCCFEVGQEVADVFSELFPDADLIKTASLPGKYHVNLWEANRLELLDSGLKPENIEVAGMCSVCHPDHFFSYRRDGKKAGRFGAGIALRKAQRMKNEK